MCESSPIEAHHLTGERNSHIHSDEEHRHALETPDLLRRRPMTLRSPFGVWLSAKRPSIRVTTRDLPNVALLTLAGWPVREREHTRSVTPFSANGS